METECDLSFCTCEHPRCVRRVNNSPDGCTSCIKKNLRFGEIPNCFFNAVGAPMDRPGDTYADFARCVAELKK